MTLSCSSRFFFSSSRRTSTNVWNGDLGASLCRGADEGKDEEQDGRRLAGNAGRGRSGASETVRARWARRQRRSGSR